jgi:hypothetical protein
MGSTEQQGLCTDGGLRLFIHGWPSEKAEGRTVERVVGKARAPRRVRGVLCSTLVLGVFVPFASWVGHGSRDSFAFLSFGDSC